MWIAEFLKDAKVLLAITSVLGTMVVFIFGTFKPKKKALNPEKYQPFVLKQKLALSHDTRMFRFALQSPKHVLGLPIGKHVSMKFVGSDGKTVTRSYTPTTSDLHEGYVDFVIKVYFPNVDPRFPEGGKMSMHLEGLEEGSTMDMMGPKGNLTYLGVGNFRINRRDDRKVRKLGMMAGGTGITPMLQIISAILRERTKIDMSLIFANKTIDDILLRDLIDDLVAKNPNFKVHFTVDKAPADWKYSQGFITKEMVEKHMPPPGDSTLVLMCGPPPMLKYACIPALEGLKYSEEMYFSF